MTKYIIVIYTDIFGLNDFNRLLNLRELFPCIFELSIDFIDCDKVLRVGSVHNIGRLIIAYLEIEEVKCKLMGIYQELEGRAIVLFEGKDEDCLR